MSLQLTDLMAHAKRNFGFNDIEFYVGDKRRKPLETQPVTQLLGKEVAGIEAFAEHGSGSLFALWKGHVVWLDSAGEQCVIAKDVDDFVDALLLDSGAVWDVASSCQETDSFVASFRNGRHRTLEQMREAYLPEYVPNVLADTRARYREPAEKFSAWARQHGRDVPADIVDRMVALRPLTAELRAICSSSPADASTTTPTPSKREKKVAISAKRSTRPVKASKKKASSKRATPVKAAVKKPARAKAPAAKTRGKPSSRRR